MNNERFEELKRIFLPRFWDTGNNVMVYPKLNNYGLEDKIEYNTKDYGFISLSHILIQLYDEFKEMKPTGLKDKNGTLIYEGDLVKCSIGDASVILQIVWDDKQCAFAGKRTSGELVSFRVDSHPGGYIEIVGNIHTDKGE